MCVCVRACVHVCVRACARQPSGSDGVILLIPSCSYHPAHTILLIPSCSYPTTRTTRSGGMKGGNEIGRGNGHEKCLFQSMPSMPDTSVTPGECM
eukprot:365495-Chlamydomonas_euryale.AAC.14